ncbi:DUF3169 family protein [Siminovitchia fordii]|uniref:DUF3169 family protein n=1 Tax=Siminovitchia fordii TaxID=254759 RepID=A0ABQ4KE13_9BACI|nr:DUF3169 family protein [Siminovitchia fordii]GIN23312.1 hypothetical protein J1TS3_44460 [Siminovitchia fordii]
MKLILQFFISGVVGFFGMYALMNFSEVNFSGEITVISLIAISIILITMGIIQFQKIKFLNKQNFSGDEEDEVEERKYKMFANYSLYANSSFVLSILTLSLSLLTTQNLVMTIASIFLLIITYFLIHYMGYLMQQVYPERNIPSTSDPDYAKSLLDIADDGEKHVMLTGLYKSHSLLNISLIVAIILSTVYSFTGEDSQIFSIILMAVVLLIVNSKYLLVVRNK